MPPAQDDYFVGIDTRHEKSVQQIDARNLTEEFFYFQRNRRDRWCWSYSCSAAWNTGMAGGFMNVEVMAERVRAEFEEMPGMMLTMPQASRLFGLEHEVC